MGDDLEQYITSQPPEDQEEINALGIVLDLARMQPLVLKTHQDPQTTWYYGNLVYNYHTVYTWACRFCECDEPATCDVLGNPYGPQAEFQHAANCIWERAKEIVDG